MNETKTFTVDRPTWHRGQGSIGSYLLLQNGSRCCLGHVGKQCNIPDNLMLESQTPVTIGNTKIRDVDRTIWHQALKLWPRFLIEGNFDNSGFCKEAMEINDSKILEDDVRESRLSKIFAKNGYQLFFEN